MQKNTFIKTSAKTILVSLFLSLLSLNVFAINANTLNLISIVHSKNFITHTYNYEKVAVHSMATFSVLPILIDCNALKTYINKT